VPLEKVNSLIKKSEDRPSSMEGAGSPPEIPPH